MGKKITMFSTESSSIQERFERLMPSLFLYPEKIKMLDRNEFCLRQGFRAAKTLVTRDSARWSNLLSASYAAI